jgi:hypothetical protein
LITELREGDMSKMKKIRFWQLFAIIILGIGSIFWIFNNSTETEQPFPLAPPVVYAQTPLIITLDGLGNDWTDTAWRLITGIGGNLFITVDTLCGGGSLNTTPNSAPCFARTGYDITDLWAYYQVTNNSWYFRLDVDSRPGDSDSVVGTAGSLGVGTDGFDTGALTGGDPDPDGVGRITPQEEKYFLQLGPSSSSLSSVATLVNDAGPDTLFTLTAPDSTLTGEAIYSTVSNPGIVEWRIDKNSLFPPGSSPQAELWIRAFADSDFDRVGEDVTEATMVLGIDITNSCPPDYALGAPMTFDIIYSINAASTYPLASDVTITAPVPNGTTYQSCSGGTCSENSGLITWNLGTLPRGTSGTVSFVVILNTGNGVTTDAEITIAEGLRDQATASGCALLEPTPVPTKKRKKDDDEPPTPTPAPTATPTPFPTPTPTPSFPTTLPETGNNFGMPGVFYGLMVLGGGTAIFWGGRSLIKRRFED